ncbi:hypothetical protein Ahy_A05g022635 [Arachis hypogaea]|uniref:Late embryogenesis abundant protein LEA-2 subgroup domain-containing protein n=1 Tax=Arachis hypogaea TaxID=3818 RepID=A0A445D128_ARAHY|nr:NDR1/HIN1-like protein 10 [Arachis hypogaea]RYR56896.1 hypothetical protein Ahy_A05g022635 [Arachis hypogaea]
MEIKKARFPWYAYSIDILFFLGLLGYFAIDLFCPRIIWILMFKYPEISRIKLEVTNASLTQSKYLNSNSMLYSNLEVNITATNPNNNNNKVVVSYDKIMAEASFQGCKFSSVTNLTDIHENNTSFLQLPLVLKGQCVIHVTLDEAYKAEARKGVNHDLDLKLGLWLDFQYANLKKRKSDGMTGIKASITCPSLSFISNDKSAISFGRTKCKCFLCEISEIQG